MEYKISKVDSYTLTGNPVDMYLVFAGGEDPHGGLMDYRGGAATFEEALLKVEELSEMKFSWYQIFDILTNRVVSYKLEEIV